MSFANLALHPNILKAIKIKGYNEPTPVQAAAIPPILSGKDVIAAAQTGTGKTAAFILPALQKICSQKSKGHPRILVLTPTRELARQVNQAARDYGRYLRFQLANLVGGMSYTQQLRELKGKVDLVVATPGRLIDHMENNRIDLSHIEMLILDEADRMLDMGFIDDVKFIAKKITRTHQTLLFSATIDARVTTIVKQLLKEPVKINITPEKMTPSHIDQRLHFTSGYQHKIKLLEHYLANEQIYKAIIFTSTKLSADQLAKTLVTKGYQAAPLHGDLRQSKRNRIIEQLKKGRIQYLVATDVAARGIDISNLTHVFNFDLPKFSEDYVHRIGRTGRAGKTGAAISFVLPNERIHVNRIEKLTQKKIENTTIPGLEIELKPDNQKKRKSGYSGKKKPTKHKNFKKSFKKK